MSAYETVEVPFKMLGNRQCLTFKQVAEEPWLKDFMRRFPHCFEQSVIHDVWFYYPDGRPQ